MSPCTLLLAVSGSGPTQHPQAPVVEIPALVVISAITGGIVLACIATSLIKTLGSKALDKADAPDVPAVLGVLATWISPLTGFLPRLPERGHSPATRQLTSAAADDRMGPHLQEEVKDA